jgi:hypothetical protein
MDVNNNYFESLKFKYSKETGKISSVKVVFDEETGDNVTISKKFLDELENYDISFDETSKELFYILARAIQLKAENCKGSSDGKVRKYDFGTKTEPFQVRFITRLSLLLKNVPIEDIATFFGTEAKVAYLDFFLNKKDVYELTILFREGFDDCDLCGYLGDDFDE